MEQSTVQSQPEWLPLLLEEVAESTEIARGHRHPL
jgi:hypothetical protein